MIGMAFVWLLKNVRVISKGFLPEEVAVDSLMGTNLLELACGLSGSYF